ncbi:hypothetical protein PIB30_004855 [Stylosanthes scabra]|uniref:Uncharacterized protein n=1 Tax=Stylosanthes scabra TaxID=79078 RepID=A0ABU6V555_9FABA|nr:hypothetical protein [Stylosanthes scabra]
MLMKDIGSEQACTQSTWLFLSSNPIRPESSMSLFEDARLSSTKMVLPERHDGIYSSIHQKPLGLQLCSDQLASHVDHESLNLPFSGVDDNRRMKSTSLGYLDQIDNSCTQNVIDLEVSLEERSNENGIHGACTTAISTVCNSDSQISVFSGQMKNSSFPCGDAEFPHGFQDCRKALINKSSPKDCIARDAQKFDLNEVQFYDSASNSSDSLVTSHSSAKSFHIFGISFDSSPGSNHPCSTQRKQNSKSLSDDASKTLQLDETVNPVVVNTNSNSNGTKVGEAIILGSKYVSRTKVNPCKDLSYCTSDLENKDTGSTRNPSVVQFIDSDLSCACQSQAEEKYVDGNALCESCCIVDSSDSLKDRQPKTNLGETNLNAPVQNLGTDEKVVELPEASMCVQSAAQLLVKFSLNSSSKTERIKVDKEEIVKVERADSYEQIALELEECNDDDCSASSKAYEVDMAKTNDFSLRLKRGRRFKDFHKEILPGLASLSRHEIQEDINILEAVLRSREYRKIRSRMGDHSNQCAPTRRVRSKRNYGWRKFL